MAIASATSTLVRTHELETDSNKVNMQFKEEDCQSLRGIVNRHKEP